MKLSERVLDELAKMVIGDNKLFPYRSSTYITKFFSRCGLPFKHDGSMRPIWTAERLAELNLGSSQSPDLPSDDLCRVITELFELDDFERYNDKPAPDESLALFLRPGKEGQDRFQQRQRIKECLERANASPDGD